MTEKLQEQGISIQLPETCNTCDFYSDLFRGVLKVDQITRGRVICSFTVVPSIAVAERVAIAFARTIVPEDETLFPGELSISSLSAAPINFTSVEMKNIHRRNITVDHLTEALPLPEAELVADGSVARSGRDMTVVSVEFRLKNHGKLVYTAQVTLFHIAVPKL